MPYVGGSVDKRLQELKERQAARRSEVAAANRREDVKLSTFLGKLDDKHDRDMINLNTKLHVTKIDLVREIQKDPSPKLLQQVKKGSKHPDEILSARGQPLDAKFAAMKLPMRQRAGEKDGISVPTPKLYRFI